MAFKQEGMNVRGAHAKAVIGELRVLLGDNSKGRTARVVPQSSHDR